MPLFDLANTAIIISLAEISNIPMTVFTGIFLGLLIGKPVGIVLFTYLFSKLSIITLPSNAAVRNIIGIGFLGGVGFTMAIFISFLAFGDGGVQTVSKLAILSASVVSGLIGYVLLKGR
jgi:NhaA family Na+:H+ antiporter